MTFIAFSTIFQSSLVVSKKKLFEGFYSLVQDYSQVPKEVKILNF